MQLMMFILGLFGDFDGVLQSFSESKSQAIRVGIVSESFKFF